MFKRARQSQSELEYLTSNGVKRNSNLLNFSFPRISEIIRLTRSVPDGDPRLKELRRELRRIQRVIFERSRNFAFN